MIQSYLTNTVERYASKWLVLAIDVVIVCMAFVLSYFVRFNLTFDFAVENLYMQVPLVAIVALFSFLIIGSYKGVIRHTGIKDVYNIFNAICLTSIIAIFIVLTYRSFETEVRFTIPLSIIIINSLISFIGMVSSRYVFKVFYLNVLNENRPSSSKNIVIYGAGESGILTYNAIINLSKNNVKVVGFVDNDKKKIGKVINGVSVYSPDVLTEDFIVKRAISEIIFCIQTISSSRLKALVEGLVDFPVVVKIVPPIEDWINGELKASQIKNIQIEDLLNRAPIDLDNLNIEKELYNKTILVTGGAGSIGSELVRQICNFKYKSLIIIDQAESALYDLQQELKQKGFHNFSAIVGDVRDKKRMNNLFEEHKPNMVFHAAAYKHVPLMEQNSYEAIKINIAGTKNIADLSAEHEVDKFVLVSTDKAVNPTNIMGASKRIAEIYVSCLQQLSDTRYIITRFGNVLGSNGSVIPLFRKQIEKGGPLTLTHKDITRYFMTIPEASQLVLEAGSMGVGGEIFIFDMGESVKIFDLAKNMIKLSGLLYPEDIDIIITGLRPGEKLYEELLANGENTLPTYHKKIKISKARKMEYGKLKSLIDELCIANMFFGNNTVQLMKDIVPEFISNNSEFCKLDKKKNTIFEDEGKIIARKTAAI
ncbi:polysaccharide biosynthesis protein [Croceitalea rosinachiae]|uniref:Nucleoside-diphosphate sugar epimerase/dehydratase n=1 Tax=Croceitalea rosinachiae TaxID=3075596 RepID=A0ABU3ACC6_9FLAO|nr:nucleoside-diphosphate sugar epimerase/dehydratase [Croceitalea sp. F388]MDT0607826.1 nucleoside-diphosphate sugar epimerase/dehydratase [Croceitalea sp. F388]